MDDLEGVVDLGDDVLAIDTYMSGYSDITASYLIRSSRPCLIETGTATSAARVRSALHACGVDESDLATIVVTHIHLDHAGGVGDIAREFPRAKVVVHERGARHLADPSRLMASAARVYGPALDTVFGRLEPTPAERLVAVGEQAAIDLGDGRELRSYYSPGHAQHHVGLLDSQTGDLYVGDAVGVYVQAANVLKPATPPPDFDLDLALSSIERFAELRPSRLLFSHYGPVADVPTTLERAAEELRLWVDLVREADEAGLELDHAVAMVRERTRARYEAVYAAPELDDKFEHLSSTTANVTGIRRWLAAGTATA